jgi:hypothetical protein
MRTGRRAGFAGALLAGTLLVLSGASAGSEAASTSGSVSAQPPGRFSNLRVCTYPAFSLAERRCTRDQRTEVLVSGKFACSVLLRVIGPRRLHARLTLDGRPVYAYTTRRKLEKGAWAPWISENLGPVPLPGGRWGCDFSLGAARAHASFRSGGPGGAIIGAAVCDARDSLFYAHHRIRTCRLDESGRPVRATDRILCSAVFVKQVGRQGGAQLLAGDKDAAKPDIERIPSLLSIFWNAFAPASPAADGTFPAGDYVCRFSVDGVTIVDKPFRIISR